MDGKSTSRSTKYNGVPTTSGAGWANMQPSQPGGADMKPLSILILTATFTAFAGKAPAAEDDSLFIVQDLSQSVEEAADAVQQYVEDDDDWLFLARFGLLGGQVTALKICYLPIGSDIFAAGMQVAAMMPCGNLAFYEEDGQARMSMLDLAFLQVLHPDPHIEQAVEKGAPAFAAMLENALD